MYSRQQPLFDSATADDTVTLDSEFFAATPYPLALVFETTGFSGTLDFQGRASARETWRNTPYYTVPTSGPAGAPVNDQVSLGGSTTTLTYILVGVTSEMRVVMTRTQGSISGEAWSHGALLNLAHGTAQPLSMLSTETKPTDVPVGTRLIERDTGDEFTFGEEGWRLTGPSLATALSGIHATLKEIAGAAATQNTLLEQIRGPLEPEAVARLIDAAEEGV